MKRSVISLLLLLFIIGNIQAQGYLKTEYFGTSSYRDQDNKKVGNGKGSALVYEGGISIPFSVKMNKNDRPSVWGVALAGSYTNFNNRGMSREYCPDEIMNLSLNLMHMRPLNEKWSAMGVIGAGIYTPHADFSRINMRQVLGNGGVVFIRHLKKNLDIGGGLALNNSFGYPMIFPAMVLQWKLEGKYEVHVQMMNAIELSAGVKLTEYMKLFVKADMNGAMALEKIEGKNMIFTHQYVNVDLQPLFLLGKGFSVPVTVGVTPYRGAFYQENSLKAFFSDSGGEHDPHFAASFHFSVGLRYGF